MASPKSRPRSRSSSAFCGAINCRNSFYKEDCKGKSFFRFPKDKERCQIWIQNTRRADLIGLTPEEISKKDVKLCSDHFEDNQFNVPSERKRLVWNAVPTFFDIPNPPLSVTPKRKCQARRQPEVPNKKQRVELEDSEPQVVTETDASCATEKLAQKLKATRNKLYRREARIQNVGKQKTCELTKDKRREIMLKEMRDILPSKTADFIERQLCLFQKKSKGRRWSERDKVLALSLFHTSRKCYRLLKKLFLLPSISCLRSLMGKIDIYPGVNECIMKALEQKIKALPPGGELCSLVIDEVSIKEWVEYNAKHDDIEGIENYGVYGKTKFIANHATVFMVRGIKVNWKQPVADFLSHGPIDSSILKSLMLYCLDRLLCQGLDVKCIVTDQGSNNQKMFCKLLSVNVDTPFFLHNGKKFNVIYDPPHLLKNIRNNLKTSGFTYDGNSVKWQHIVDFYETDRKNKLRLAPKLTDRHITLPPFSKLKVKLATQVLSHTVASGVSFLGKVKGDDSAEATADFIEMFDVLFNCFNSRHFSSKQRMGHVLSEKSGHIAFLNDTLKWFEKLKSNSKTPNLPCISGWKISIKSLLSLWEDLRENHNFTCLLTSRLNQDCLENLFSQIRGHNAHIDRPSAAQFRTYLSRTMVQQIFSHPKGANCEEDTDFFLLTLQEFSRIKTSADMDSESLHVIDFESLRSKRKLKPLVIEDERTSVEDDFVSNLETNVVSYISGFILRKIKDKICLLCNEAVISTDCNAQEHQFILYKQYSEAKEGLIFPSLSFVDAMNKLENLYCQQMSTMSHTHSIKQKLYLSLTKSEEINCLKSLGCGSCNLVNPVIQSFIHIRLRNSLKQCCLRFTRDAKKVKKSLQFGHQ